MGVSFTSTLGYFARTALYSSSEIGTQGLVKLYPSGSENQGFS